MVQGGKRIPEKEKEFGAAEVAEFGERSTRAENSTERGL